MLRTSARGALLVAGIALVLFFPGCGKKAPLRLSDDRSAEHAPALRARMREDRLTLDFRVPAHRSFPEREDPWVLARILRQASPSAEVVEAGAILKTDGFAFDSPLSWSEQIPSPAGSFVMRVEFRDAARRRRALTEPLTVSWQQPPDAPSNLSAAGHLRSIVLTWTAPGAAAAATKFLVYRREAPQVSFERVSPEPVADLTFLDQRIKHGSEYCYVVRALLNYRSLEIEGPATPESCSRAADEEPPGVQPPARTP